MSHYKKTVASIVTYFSLLYSFCLSGDFFQKCSVMWMCASLGASTRLQVTSSKKFVLDYPLQQLIKNNLDTTHILMGQKPMGLFCWWTHRQLLLPKNCFVKAMDWTPKKTKHSKSLEIIGLQLVIYKLFLCSSNILLGFILPVNP